jgi:hypothetical protein
MQASSAAGRDRAGSGGFVISLDFELMWGMRDHATVASYGANILGGREAIPRLLDLFARHDLACTWATVGLLMCGNRAALEEALPAVRPAYANRALSPYDELGSIGESERDDPYHYGRSLVRRIAATPRQEIATHTFSHYYCLEPGSSREAFRADLAAAQATAAREGIVLESIVFPRNQVNAAYLDDCRSAGLIAYRGTEPARIYRPAPSGTEPALKRALRLADAYVDLTGANTAPPRVDGGLVNVASSRFLRPWSGRLAPLEPLRLGRILRAMRHAARAGGMFHLWFHPHNFGANQGQNLAVMGRIAAEAVRLREVHGWPSLTMAEAARRALAP